jgi:hypothetical protein
VVPPDASCTIPTPAGDPGRVNIGLVSPRCEGGICADESATCVVPLDSSAPAGWNEIGGRIHLPPAACRKARGVLVSTSCPTKTASIPTCGPWSEILAPAGTFNATLPDAGAAAGTCPDAAAD